jgi:hypothetical protein
MAIQLPRDLGFNPAGWRVMVDAVMQLVEGRHYAGGVVQLAAGPATSTVVNHPNCSKDCFPMLTPVNAAAAAEYGAGTCYVDEAQVDQGSFVIQHSASASARRFFYTVTGG